MLPDISMCIKDIRVGKKVTRYKHVQKGHKGGQMLPDICMCKKDIRVGKTSRFRFAML